MRRKGLKLKGLMYHNEGSTEKHSAALGGEERSFHCCQQNYNGAVMMMVVLIQFECYS